MKKFIFRIFLIILFFLISLIIILSTIGIETQRFNRLISEKIVESDKRLSVQLEKIKFKFDVKNFNLFIETKNPILNYQNLVIPIKNIKAYLDFFSIIKSKPIIEKINFSSEEIDIVELKKLIVKTKPSNLNSLVINKIEKGKLTLNMELYFDKNLKLDNFISRGEVKEMEAKLDKNTSLKKTSFTFFADKSDILIKNISSQMANSLIKNGNLKIRKEDTVKIESDFVTEIKIDKRNINQYLPYLKNFQLINENTILNAKLENFLEINFDKTFKVIDYSYKNKGDIDNLILKMNKSYKNNLINEKIDSLYLKKSTINFTFNSKKKNTIDLKGNYSFNNEKYQNFALNNIFFKNKSNILLDIDFIQNIKIDLINYEKKTQEIANITLDVVLDKNLIKINQLQYQENQNSILIEDLKINKDNLVSLKKIKVKTFKKNDLKNDFHLIFDKGIKIYGAKYDAKNINKLLSTKSDSSILKNINENIDIDLKNIETPLSKKLINFKLLGVIEKGKFVKLTSKGDFGNDKFLDISIKKDKNNKKKYLEVYSDLPQPLLSEYSFFNGLTGGILIFNSIIDENSSTSKLIIQDFKVVNAPGVVKLLALADFGGLADLAEGEGLSFEKMEITMSNDKKVLTLNELYAVGSSISVLMEGYKEESGLTSLRGTLVPAKNLNNFLSKIPVIGKIIIPKEIGEGLFGVSFKMKGMPGKIKTTINPIKTLTPRFITKALEKSKKSK